MQEGRRAARKITPFGSALAASVILVSAASVFAADTKPAAIPAAVTAAVNDRGRPPWDVDRDALRHPTEVLAFAQVKPGQVVVDLVPGMGYYTRILAKLVGPKGKVYAVVPAGGGAGGRRGRIAQRLNKAPATVPAEEAQTCVQGCYPEVANLRVLPIDHILAIENIDEYKNVTALWEQLGQYGGELALPEQADVVFTADGWSTIHGKDEAIKDAKQFIQSVYHSLKPGGIFLISDKAAPKGTGFTYADIARRTEADAVKAEMTAAGFVLDGESNTLVNPNDDKTKGTGAKWADGDRADHYVLRFKKPANAPNTDKRPKNELAIMKNYYGNTFEFNIGATGKKSGARVRFTYYNSDHTYQEFGRVGDGPGPMQAGTWWWDADGHNCMLHQFPTDERGNVVCHTDMVARALDTVVDDHTAGAGDVKIGMVRGYHHPAGGRP
jgi:predicted methyltransferase